MRAIILAESSQCDLSPLTNRIPHPLLPLAGKPILTHALEILHRSSIRNVEVVAPTLHSELEYAIDTGPLLGMHVHFAPDMTDLRQSKEHCLIIGLRHLVDINWNEAIGKLGELKRHTPVPIMMLSSGNPVALLVSRDFDGNISCDWSDIHHSAAVHLSFNDNRVINTSSINEYYDANFSMVKGQFQYLTPAGREFTYGHRAAPRARIDKESIFSTHGYFGSNSNVDRSASLRGNVILGDNVKVDKGACVSDSIILDNTYIGVNTDCKHAIVSGGLLIKVDSGVSLELNDPVLFGAV